MASQSERSGGKRQLVAQTAQHMRERIFASPPGTQIGSLPDLARDFEVGIVTVQQAARILEHEGVLEVRRGPGGGYYGRRPDRADLERLMFAFMREEPASRREVLDITSLLFNRLCASAARCTDEVQRENLRKVAERIATSDDGKMIGPLEADLQDALFHMVDRPLFELLTRVALGFAQNDDASQNLTGVFELEQWKHSRHRIIEAILQQDPELAQFEANRQNREVLVRLYNLDDY